MGVAVYWPLAAVVLGTMMVSGCVTPPPSGTFASAAKGIFQGSFDTVKKAAPGGGSTCSPTDELKAAIGPSYQPIVGRFLLAHRDPNADQFSLTPNIGELPDPTGLMKTFGNSELASLIESKVASKRQSTVPVSPAGMTFLGIETLIRSTALLHHQGDFLQMAMQIDCGWRHDAEQKLFTEYQPGSSPSENLALHKWLVRFLVYEAAYFNAYIRNGEFGTIAVSATDLKSELQTLASGNPDFTKLLPTIDALIDQGTPPNFNQFGKIGTAGFVDVLGNKYQIQTVQAEIGETKRIVTVSHVDYAAAEAGLVRIFLEALFDASDRVPAVSAATGAPKGLTTELADLGLPMGTPAANQFIDEVALPVITSAGNGATVPGMAQPLTNDDVTSIEKGANNAETAASAVIEALPEGALGFTPTPALRTILQTAVGVTARKAAEDIGWSRLGYHPPS